MGKALLPYSWRKNKNVRKRNERGGKRGRCWATSLRSRGINCYTQLFCEMHLSEAGVQFHLPLFFFTAKLIIQQTRRGEEKMGGLKSTR